MPAVLLLPWATHDIWLSLFVDINSMWRQGKRRGYNGQFRPADKPGCHHHHWVILSISFRITRCLLLNTDIPICKCPTFFAVWWKSNRNPIFVKQNGHFLNANVCWSKPGMSNPAPGGTTSCKFSFNQLQHICLDVSTGCWHHTHIDHSLEIPRVH